MRLASVSNPLPQARSEQQRCLLERESGALTLLNKRGNAFLFKSLTGSYFRPVLNGQRVKTRLVSVSAEGNSTLLSYEGDGIDEMVVEFHESDDGLGLDCSCTFKPSADAQLNRIELFPAGSQLNIYDVVNYRNRHYTPATWPELPALTSIETCTYSSDWQFSPHPTVMLFRKNDDAFFAGFLELQPSYGMYLKVERGELKHWYLDYGDVPHGLPLKAGENFHVGQLRIFICAGQSVSDIYATFGQMLIGEKRIPDPIEKQTYDWWFEPLYCTWNDQRMLANCRSEAELVDQTVETVAGALQQLNEGMVRRAVEVIRRERLPVRTILLDEGWAISRGDWRPHPDRFTDFRKLVDDLHALGFKVMVWWNWAEIAKDADVPVSELAGEGWVNRRGYRWRDYSDPQIRERYLKPLMRTLFSDAPGCYHLDGVKTDFLADKVHPENPLRDLSWRGEEQYFYKIFQSFYTEMRRHKPDALHLGCAGNYWLSPFIDLNRTYDVHSSNWIEHEERADMLKSTCPGVQVSYDMHEFNETYIDFFASAKKVGATIEIGNVLALRDDFFSLPRPADDAHWEMLRRGCSLVSE